MIYVEFTFLVLRVLENDAVPFGDLQQDHGKDEHRALGDAVGVPDDAPAHKRGQSADDERVKDQRATDIAACTSSRLILTSPPPRPVSARRHSALLLENAVEVVYIVNSDLPGDAYDRVVGSPEQMLCLSDPVMYQIIDRRCPDGHMKAPERLAFADARGGGDVREADRVHITLRDELKHHPSPGG